MPKRTMRVLDEPLPEDARVVTAMRPKPQPVLAGGGRSTLLCGACGFPVAKRVDPAGVGALVLQCPRCGRYNSPA